MDTRKWGLRVAGLGAVTQVVGLGVDAYQHLRDESLAAHEGVFSLSNAGHALFFAGLVLVFVGLAVAFFGAKLYGPPEQRLRHDLKLYQWGAPVITAALLLGGAQAATNSTLAQGHQDHQQTNLAAGTSSAGHVHNATTATVGGVAVSDTPCDRSGPPASEGQLSTESGHDHRGPVTEVAIADPAVRDKLAQQVLAARTVAARYPTAADAVKGGYFKSTVYVPCIGAHYTNVRLVRPYVDPANPAELLFDGSGPDAKIVGLSYLVFSNGSPEGFAGPNDHWHRHNANGGLCIRAGLVVGNEKTTPADCTKRGGTKTPLDNVWMCHMWIVSGWESNWGLFAPEHPNLGGRIGGSINT
jgi:hypothetical protein